MTVSAASWFRVSPAMAAGPGDPRGPFALAGKIAAIGDGSVTIQVLAGNKIVKPYVGQELTVTAKLVHFP